MNIYNMKLPNNTGEEVSFERFKDKVLLIVNTATGCGFTPQYKGLQRLYDLYKEKGLEILDFPSDQFHQAPESDEEIQSFCSLNYGTTFPRFQKVDVNGENESPLFTFLKNEKSGMLGEKIKWNFTKFLVDRNGNVVRRFAPTDTPEKIEKYIQELL